MDEKYMLMAIELAKKGKGKVNPNPLVGAVIVKEGRVIGKGYHTCYGNLHAEREAIKSLEESAEGSDMYVTLEPCCHYGKQPPCTLAVIESGVKNVYIGSSDPNPLVAGKGIKQLEDAGIHVECGVCKKECDDINKVFFHYITNKRPYVVMKYAQTLDGKIACHTGLSRWITSESARKAVQETRNELKAIMVGVGTVIKDDPGLECHLENGRNPIRIICDSHLRTPLNSHVVETARDVQTIIATITDDKSAYKLFEAKGVQIVKTAPEAGRVNMNELMDILGAMNIDGILLEGGANLNAAALEAGIVNHLQVYIAPKIFGGENAPTAVSGVGVSTPDEAYILKNRKITIYDEDILLEYDVTN